jgi:hypothetical protein
MKTKPYTKNKKKTKNYEWEKSGLNCTMPVKSVRLKKESQLDRIERKLDELLKRQPIVLSPQPMQWIVPRCPSEEPRYPTDPFGHPVPYGVSCGGTR